MNSQKRDLREPIVHVVLIDNRGNITDIQTHGSQSSRRGNPATGYVVGESYFDQCNDEASRADVQALLKRKRTLTSFVTTSQFHKAKLLFAVLGVPVSPDAGSGAVLMHVDITAWVGEGNQNTDALMPMTLNPALIQNTVSNALFGHLAEPQRSYQSQPDIESLSPRQYEVLMLVAAGKSNLEISEELECSLNTVKRHVTAVLQKLHLPNRTRAAMLASQLNLLPANRRR